MSGSNLKHLEKIKDTIDKSNTLTDEEIEALASKIIDNVCAKTGGVLRG